MHVNVMTWKFCNLKQIQICIVFRHLGNSDCTGSWLTHLTFAAPYCLGMQLHKLVHFLSSHIWPA